jgi:outer membrane protein TolC
MKIISPSNINRFMIPAIILSLLFPFITHAQDSLTLDFCYRQAEKTYPLRQQLDMLGNSNDLKVENLNKSYLPQVNINGGVSLQSDVTKLSIDLPAGMSGISMSALSKDSYKLTLDVNQVIYDGHVTHYQKQVEEFNLKTGQKGVEIELYKLKDRINQVFFGIILLQQNEELLMSNKERIVAKLGEVQSAIRNGASLEMNGSLLEAEIVRIDQQLAEIRMDRSAYYQMLSELMSTPVQENTRLIIPQVALPGTAFENKRLENELFELERSQVNLMQNMVTTKWNPKIFAYGQAGYGRPGLNMLENSFSPWWIVGAKVTWNPWNWNHNKNEKKILVIQNDILKNQQETFDKNLKITSQKDLSEVLKLTELISRDDQLIALRSKITRAASSQVDNGVITTSDYLLRLNEETQSRLNLEIHKIQLIKAKLSYLYTLGKL